ncbi:MAG TPA: NAD(P)/FAD-dependent oxidoreductase [Gemmata sp.]|nr:NAD(P)/FAD-dependent oxidoreductase [Gemmata sp.]
MQNEQLTGLPKPDRDGGVVPARILSNQQLPTNNPPTTNMNADVIVIGAGPAGAVTARELSRSGCRVLLVDKASFPRSKVCGCCLNGAAVGILNKVGLGSVLTDAVPLHRVSIAAGQRTADVTLPRGVALSREIFDARLVEEAVNNGVEFRSGTVAKLGEERPDGREVFLNSVPAFARVVVQASGLAGGEATPEPRSRIGAGTMIPAEFSCAFFVPGTIYMATGRHGYVGLVRVEDNRLDIAAAFDPGFIKACGGLGPAAEAILREVGWPVSPGLAELPWKGTPGLTRRPVHVAAHRLFAVGDAAGYIEPFTGEGMAWAVMSATVLAPIAARAASRWNVGLVREWEVAHSRILGHRQRLCQVVAHILRSPLLRGFAVRALGAFPILAHPVIAALNQPCHLPQITSA